LTTGNVQCSDTVGWLTGRASACKKHATFHKGSHPEQVQEENQDKIANKSVQLNGVNTETMSEMVG